MEIRDADKNLLVHLDTTEEVGDNQGYLALSTASGIISIYIPKHVTADIPTGRHFFDMFVNYERFLPGEYSTDPAKMPQWGNYHIRAVVAGTVVVHDAITQELPLYPGDGE